MPYKETQSWKVLIQTPMLVLLDVLFLIYINSSEGPTEMHRRLGLDVVLRTGLLLLLFVLWTSWKTIRNSRRDGVEFDR